jgi:hypothetical protein
MSGPNGDRTITALPLALLDLSVKSGENQEIGWVEVCLFFLFEYFNCNNLFLQKKM